MTVRQNILSVLPCVHKKNNPNDILLSLAKKFHFEGLESHYPANLSGGQQQRVALARIMASEPSIMMLDEPLSALDSYLRWQLEGELVQILEEFGGVTLYVSHNRDEVYRLCEKVCVMNSGKTEPVRTVGELFDSPDTLASALLSGCKNYSRVERVGERRIYALDWNTEFECKKNVAEDITFIGVRAHYIHLSGGGDQENVISCRVLRVTQDVFNTVINLVPGGAPPERNFSRIRMELSKESAVGINIGDTVSVHVKPEDVMLLKK
jgi:molybdate transport system ATP-binding protein